MADSVVRRFIRAIFDRDSAKKVEGELEASLAKAGKKGGENFLRELRAAFDKKMADLKVQLAQGLIDPKQFKKQADLAAKEFNTGILKGMTEARKAGTLTDSVYLKLSRTLKKVGDDGASTWDRIKGGIVRAGAALAVAFGARAAIRFGVESIREFLDSEKVWIELSGTIDATGESFARLEGQLRANATAFQDATIHTDEDYAKSLQRLIAITGDVSASIHNMNFVADVAARFFGGDLTAATDAVAKGMNTGVVTINRMKFTLEELSKRSLGAAAEQTQTLAGKVKQLTNQWSEFKETIGSVLVGNRESVGALDLVTTAVKSLTKWLGDNREELGRWIREGITAGSDALRTLLGLARDFLQLQGKLSFTVGTAPAPLANTAKGLEAQISGFSKQRKQAAEEQAKALKAVEDFQKSLFGGDRLVVGLIANVTKGNRLRQELQSANDQLEKIDDNAARAKAKLESLGKDDVLGGPKLGKNATPKELTDHEKAVAAELKKIATDAAITRVQIEQNTTAELATEMVRRADMLKAATAAEKAALEAAWAKRIAPEVLDRALELPSGKAGLTPGIPGMQGLRAAPDIIPAAAKQAQKFESVWVKALDTINEEVAGQGTLFAELGQAWANGGLAGLAQLAKHKVRENIAWALEEVAKGFGSLFLNPPEAAAHFKSAAEHGVAAAAWGGVGLAGGGGGGTSAAGGGFGGTTPNLAASQRAEPPKQEVTIVLSGPGFHAMNPKVQEVIWGAEKMARERFGRNAVVRIKREG